uniref:type II toxin-antitoxin system TacA family antitoxin n=1 Tax=Thauera butanivorans TaxID=86174 RepID=UPI0008394DF3
MPQAVSTARLEARISTDLHAMLKRAAELQGRTMTDFVVSAVQEAAQRAIEQAEVIRLSLADQKRFAEALLSPPPPSDALL